MRHEITTPRPFQREGVRAIQWAGGRALLADDPGLGKTLQSIHWAWKYLPDDPPGPTVVVCPPHLKIYWQREVRKHVGWHFDVLSGEKVPPDRRPPDDPNAGLIVGHNILEQPRREGVRTDVSRSWWFWLRDLRPRLVIGDEIHWAKEPRAERSKAFRRLIRGVPYLILMSGTPAVNNTIELFNTVNMLWPHEFPSRWDFGNRYSFPELNRWGRWEFRGGRNLDELNDRLRAAGMIRRLKRDVMAELPRKTITVVPVELDRAGRREYDEAADEFLLWLEKRDPAAAQRASKAEGLTRLGYLRRLTARLKFPQVVAWIEDFLSGGSKLLVGAVHKSVVRGVGDAFPGRSVVVDGDLSTRDKQAAFDRFNADPRCDLLSGNVQAAGTGWSCRATSDVMLPELPWTPGELAQFLDRVHGIGRGVEGVAVNAYLLVAEDTIDEDLCEVIQSKQEVLTGALDGGAGGHEFDTFDQLARMTRRRAERKARVRR